MTPIATVLTTRAVLVLGVLTLSALDANAVGLRTKMACASDYFANCSQFSPDSPQTRQCMRNVGTGLSKACVSALIADGEVSQAEVNRRRGASQQASY